MTSRHVQTGCCSAGDEKWHVPCKPSLVVSTKGIPEFIPTFSTEHQQAKHSILLRRLVGLPHFAPSWLQSDFDGQHTSYNKQNLWSLGTRPVFCHVTVHQLRMQAQSQKPKHRCSLELCKVDTLASVSLPDLTNASFHFGVFQDCSFRGGRVHPIPTLVPMNFRIAAKTSGKPVGNKGHKRMRLDWLSVACAAQWRPAATCLGANFE